MIIWNMESSDKYEQSLRWYLKKRPNELRQVLVNLSRYMDLLNDCGLERASLAGFVHREPRGIVAIDQKGGGRNVKLEQTRMYLFPDQKKHTVYLLSIGNKSSQKQDLKECQKMIENYGAI